MKKLFILSILFFSVVLAVGISCKGGNWKDLEYSDVSAFDWLQASVKNKSGETVLWFQIFDQVEDKLTIDQYKSSTEKVGKYPAKIFENKWIWLMVNERIEIRLVADEKQKEFQNTEKLKNFILSFDLAGMEKVTGPKIKGNELKKFIPGIGKK